jgi:hypothetical protein
MFHEREIRIRLVRFNVAHIARHQVVHHGYVVSLAQQAVRQMRTDKSGATRDKNPQ